MPKLLQINPVLRMNTSTGRIMQEIGDVAMSAGWESFVAYSKGRDGMRESTSKTVPVGNRFSVAVHGLGTRLFDRHGLASNGATKAFIKKIEEIDPDIIHIHNIHGYFLNYQILFDYLSRAGKPVIWTIHDCWLYTGHCYYYTSAGCDRWKTGCGHCPQKRQFPASLVFDRSEKNFKDKANAFCSMPKDLMTIVPVSEWQKFSFGDVRMDAMLNLCNAFHGYKAEGRFWNPSLYAGLGFAWTYDEPGNGKSRSHEISASIGTSNDFRLSDAWAINLDVRGMFVNDRFDGEMGHRWGEGVLSATIGLTYNIAPRGWNKSKTVVKTVNNNIADFQKALSESEAERIRLEKELGELRAQPQIVEKQTTIAAPYFVIFEINKSKLSKDSRVNLGMLAEIIKANNIKYIVTGYADAATGNKKINDKLSRKRAEAVYECLTKEFGVPESLLEIDHKGGVENMFYDDPALSRAAITKAL